MKKLNFIGTLGVQASDQHERDKHSQFENNLNPCFVETGTHYGHGVISAIYRGCRDIHTIEIQEHFFQRNLSVFQNCLSMGNYKEFEIETYMRKDFFSIILDDALRINMYCGDSCEVLPKVLERIDTKATFWLDGHYSGGETGISEIGGKFPVYKELEAFLDHDIKNHTIMIDDMIDFEAKFPGELPKLKALLYSINEKYTITKEVKPDNKESYILLAKMNEDD
jgi:hypothetical protein